MGRKYPLKLFIFGVFLNFFFHYFLLFLVGVILCVVGIWSQSSLCVGLALLGLDLILSIRDQLEIRKAALSESDNPEFNEIMDTFLGEDSPDGLLNLIGEKMANGPEFSCAEDDQDQRQALLEKLVVYRALRSSIHNGMTLEEMIDAFQQMCAISVGEPDDLLFETGTFDFTGEQLFYFSLVRQFEFFSGDEFVQLHLDVVYKPSIKTALLRGAKWGAPTDPDFFRSVKASRAFHTVRDLPIVKVDVRVEDT